MKLRSGHVLKFSNKFSKIADEALLRFPKNITPRDNNVLTKSLTKALLHSHKNFWKIDQPIYTGGNSTVYNAQHLKMKTEAAVKVGITSSELTIAMYLGATGLSPRVYDAWYDDANIGYMVMEKIEGCQTLNDLVQKTPSKDISELPASLLQQLHTIFDSLADYGVFHDDLHYEQFLVMKNGTVKIIDFGEPTNFIQPNAQPIRTNGHEFFETMFYFHSPEKDWNEMWKKLQEKLLY